MYGAMTLRPSPCNVRTTLPELGIAKAFLKSTAFPRMWKTSIAFTRRIGVVGCLKVGGTTNKGGPGKHGIRSDVLHHKYTDLVSIRQGPNKAISSCLGPQ